MALAIHPDTFHRPASHRAPSLPALGAPSRRTAGAATYRRRRIVAGMVLALVLLAAVRIVAAAVPSHGATAVRTAPAAAVVPEVSSGIAAREASAAPTTYVVGPGETLWSIATEIAPGRDPRPVVDRLRKLNGGAALTVGQRLVIE